MTLQCTSKSPILSHQFFLNKLMKVVIEIAPSKKIRIKNNAQEWFDREVAELIHVCEKLSLKFKKSKFHIDDENY